MQPHMLGMMKRRFPSRISRYAAGIRALTVGAGLLAFNFAALAQDTQAAPQPSLQKSPPIWLGILVIFIMLVLVVTVSLMPSRRSHQD